MINLGLPEWVAESEEEYIDKALRFAQDPEALAQVRAGMRERMRTSPLMDGAGFAREVEAAYREMYEKWARGRVENGLGAAKRQFAKETQSVSSDVVSQKESPGPQEINALVAMFAEGRYAEAADFARAIIERFPQHGFSWKVVGAVFQQMGRIEDALAPMQKAVDQLPNDAEAHHNLGNTLCSLGRLNEAEASFRRALQINPKYAKAYCNLGTTLYDLHRLNEAEVSYRQALQINPKLAVAHYNLANTLQDQGLLEEAEASYRQALQMYRIMPEASTAIWAALSWIWGG